MIAVSFCCLDFELVNKRGLKIQCSHFILLTAAATAGAAATEGATAGAAK